MTGTLSTPTAPTDFPPLTNADRCDRCGAQAYVRVVLAGGGDLLFCAHHAKVYAEKLRELAGLSAQLHSALLEARLRDLLRS